MTQGLAAVVPSSVVGRGPVDEEEFDGEVIKALLARACRKLELERVRWQIERVCALDEGLNCNRKKGLRVRLPCVGQPAGVDLAEFSKHKS